MTQPSPDSPSESTSPDGRSVDVALAEFTALRAEILAYSTSQNTFVGLGFTAIGVLGGIAIPRPEQRGLLILVPLLCSILILVHAGLAYRIVIAGNYIEHVLWPHLTDLVDDIRLPSWEAGLGGLESRGIHRYLSQIVEVLLVGLLAVTGLTAGFNATGADPRLQWSVAGFVVVATFAGALLGWRRRLTYATFRPRVPRRHLS